MWLQDSEANDLMESKCDSSCSRRFCHLLARPYTPINGNYPSCLLPYCYSTHMSNTIGISMNHHQNSVADDQASKDENHMEPLASSRWNPTPEHLMALEEMYRRGVRTPSSEEIKLIAAKLRQFGKIEGKNVFYWFQNHKSRERQKRRCQPESMSKKHVNNIQTLETKETGLEAEKNKNLVVAPNRSSTKDSGSMQRSMVTESRTAGWTHLDDRKLQQMSQREIAKGANATSLMDLSYMAPNCNLLNNITKPFTPQTSGKTQQKLFTSLNFSILSPSCNEAMINYEDESGDHPTLQLFPPRNDDDCTIRRTEKDFQELMTTIHSNLPPSQFYEFL